MGMRTKNSTVPRMSAMSMGLLRTERMLMLSVEPEMRHRPYVHCKTLRAAMKGAMKNTASAPNAA